jgi:hypothetical protein
MRRLALLAGLLAGLAGLAAAPPAVAKHLRSVTACGDTGCLTSQDRHLLAALVDVGPPSDPPSARAPFYRLTVRMGRGGETARAVCYAASSTGAAAAGRANR